MWRWKQDIDAEPFRLLEHILTTPGVPYRDLITADYTFGRSGLKLLYSSQAYLLPTYPRYSDGSALVPNPQTDPGELPSMFKPGSLPSLPLNWLSSRSGSFNDTNGYVIGGWVDRMAAFRASGIVPVRPISGILTMPAMTGPVSQKMRTLSSRYFTRLLCGDANIYAPQGAAKALHRQYMIGTAADGTPVNPQIGNATASAHLDETRGCFACHVNLDPLAQALSTRFLNSGQVNDFVAFMGEMMPIDIGDGKIVTNVRNGGQPGKGAFLGHAVEGVVQVGAVLSESREFNRCVVQKAVEGSFGRAARSEDVLMIETLTDRFIGHQDYNRLIRDIVSTKAFQVEN